VSIAGLPGSARTDAEGRFTWAPAPALPFQIIVILPGGQVARPVVIETLSGEITTIQVQALADESVTVLGAAPSVEITPAAGTTILSSTQLAQRTPEHLMQALETVPGVNQVSEGHSAVPALRGLARGRTLLLVDGARVTSERRVGPSASFLDPSVIEGIDVARGPGSVAYGSDALGGVISVRTRRAEPGSPLKGRVSGTIAAGTPEQRGSVEISKGFERGGVLVHAHVRNAEDYDSPDGEVFNSGWEDRGVLAQFNHQIGSGLFTAGWQSDFGRDVERPRNNSRAVRFYYPYEDSHRLTTSYEVADVAGFRQIALTGFFGSYDQRTDQDRVATATSGRSLERADVSARDFHVKGSAERLLRNIRMEFGVDVNGRFGLEALDITQAFDLSGAILSDVTHVSVEDARRVDTGVFLQMDSAVGAAARVSGGVRLDRVTTRNEGGHFGDRSTTNGAASGFGALTVGPFSGFSVTGQLSRGFRDPVLSDRYFRGPSGRGFVTGNPDLDPETSVQLDLAARYTRGRAQFAAYAYHYRIHDLIERYQTETDFFFFRNRGRARIRGYEVEARSELGSGYSVELSAHAARGIALDDDADLDDISPASLSIVGRKAFGARGYAQTRLAWYAEDDRPGPSEVATPGATIVDIGGGWNLGPRLGLRALARNVFDEKYYASPDPRWVYAAGRSLTLTASLQF
jgi:hemoglobin/transferrin/lactoferrin receptor protein